MELLLNKVCGQPAALPVAVRRCGPADAAAVYDSMLIDARRISAHCSNIAVSVIQRYDDRLTAHRYLRVMREGDVLFRRRVAEYAGRWGL